MLFGTQQEKSLQAEFWRTRVGMSEINRSTHVSGPHIIRLLPRHFWSRFCIGRKLDFSYFRVSQGNIKEIGPTRLIYSIHAHGITGTFIAFLSTTPSAFHHSSHSKGQLTPPNRIKYIERSDWLFLHPQDRLSLNNGGNNGIICIPAFKLCLLWIAAWFENR